MTRIRLDMFVQELLILPAAVFESPSFEYTESIARTLFDQVCSCCVLFHLYWLVLVFMLAEVLSCLLVMKMVHRVGHFSLNFHGSAASDAVIIVKLLSLPLSKVL